MPKQRDMGPEEAPVESLHQKEEMRSKNIVAEGRNRKVLQDIGNLVTNTQAVGVGKHVAQHTRHPVPNKQIVEVVNRTVKFGVAAQKKEAEKCQPKLEEVIVISSDEDEDDKSKASSQRASRIVKKTFTSSLTARSQAACGLPIQPKETIVDIDAADINNELEVVEYVDELNKFYKLTQDEGRVHDYMDSKPEINAKMRSILIDWLVEVHRKFELMPETLYLTINIIDRYLSLSAVRRKELQLVGISSMLIASKYEEVWAPQVDDFVCISDDAYFRDEVLLMEKAILEALGWYLTVPTPYVFLVRYIKASVPSDMEMENMIFYLAELGLMHYPTIVMYCPSMIAASAVYAARCTLKRTPFWNATLKHYTGYLEDQIMDCAQLLVSLQSAAPLSKLGALYKKFARSDYGEVALFPPAW